MAVEVITEYQLPFSLREYQQEAIEFCSRFDRSGLFADVGLGKTVMGTLIALQHAYAESADKVIILCPPILIPQWCAWLREFESYNPGITVEAYAGTPKFRRNIDLDADFLVMSLPIFKNDFDILKKHHRRRLPFLLVDEAAAVRRPQTLNFRKVRDFSRCRGLLLMTGTPLNSPMHAYGYIKLLTPSLYRSFTAFRNTHVAKEDYWGNPIEYRELDLLRENLTQQAILIHAEDNLDLPEIIYDVVEYKLHPWHQKLYNELVEEKLLILQDRVVDVTEATRLYHTTQQFVMAPQSYIGDETRLPSGYEIIDATLEELEGEKLIIFSNYRLTNEQIFDYLKKKKVEAVLCYGGIGAKQQDDNLQRFLKDPTCRVLVANPGSVGVGLNLQSASRAILFMELPLTSNTFNQAVGRIHRMGQDKSCLVRMAVARNTVQQTLRHRVVQKDDMVQMVLPSPKKLRSALYGGDL